MKPRYTEDDVNRFNHDMAAVHEAGHAVIAKRLGLTVNAINVSRAGGLVITDDTDDADAELVVCYAGLEAETRFLRQHGGYSSAAARRIARRHARDDLTLAKRIARRATLSQRKAHRRARRLVAWHWREIRRIGLRLAR